MITRTNIIKVQDVDLEDSLLVDGKKDLFKKAIFFDLEHYVYKKPICIGVFGCCHYDEEEQVLKVVQYMIEDKKDSIEILHMAKKYFEDMYNNYSKRYIVTFSGNNDFCMINYLINKNKIDLNISELFKEIDLQKEYEKELKFCIGLKNLEKKFGILRESELISGANLAKTFNKIMKDNDYSNRMPYEKKENILLYNEQDVVSLFHIYAKWKGIVEIEKELQAKEKLEQERLKAEEAAKAAAAKAEQQTDMDM